MRLILCVALVLSGLSSFDSFAGFGGGRSSGGFSASRSFSSPSRSSFGGFRSSGSATISRPAPSYSRPSYTAPSTHAVRETVIHRDGGGSGLLTGMLIGNMLSNHGNTTVVAGGAVPSQAVASSDGVTQVSPAVIAVEPQSSFAWKLFTTVLAIVACLALISALAVFARSAYLDLR